MPTINRHAMRSILNYLDHANAAIAKRDATEMPNTESNAAWNLRMARERLYDLVLVDITVEPMAHANDDREPLSPAVEAALDRDMGRWINGLGRAA